MLENYPATFDDDNVLYEENAGDDETWIMTALLCVGVAAILVVGGLTVYKIRQRGSKNGRNYETI